MIYAIILGLAIIVGSLFQQFWIGMGAGLAIDLILFLWHNYGSAIKKWRAEKKKDLSGKPSSAKPAVAGANASAETTTGPFARWFWRLAILGAVGYLGWSYWTEQGWPGEREYATKERVYLRNLTDQRVCSNKLRPGDWYVNVSGDVWKGEQKTRLHKTAGFYAVWPGGQARLFFTDTIAVNGVGVGTKEKVHIGPDRCYNITPLVDQAVKNTLLIYGRPDCETPDGSCVRSTTPAPAYLDLYFTGKL